MALNLLSPSSYPIPNPNPIEFKNWVPLGSGLGKIARANLDTWKRVHIKRMGPFWVWKKVSVVAYELDLRSEMDIGSVFNAEDLISYHRPFDDSTLSSASLPS